MVTNKVPKYVEHLYKPRSVKQFKADLDYFLANYEPISLTDVIAINQGKKVLSKPSFHLTFDDGLSNFYHVIAPILKERNIPATVFLNTDFVDNKEFFYRYKASMLLDRFLKFDDTDRKVYCKFIDNQKEKIAEKEAWSQGISYKKRNVPKSKIPNSEIISFLMDITYRKKYLLDELAERLGFNFKNFLATKKPYLSINQIKELQQQGFTFGSHSVDHPMYGSIIDTHVQESQTLESLAWLEKHIQPKHKTFAFPFHDIGVKNHFFDVIKDALEISFGTSGFKNDAIPTNLQRLDMEKATGSAKNFIRKETFKRKLKKPFGLHKIKRYDF
jgi:peptidoglycan/xylan/chitin deacetylase (PgdA/CDA1 family)